jgi:plastocyanin
MSRMIENDVASTVGGPIAAGGHDPHPRRDGVSAGLVAVVVGACGIMATYGEVFVDALVFLAAFVGLAIWAARSGSRRLRWVIAGLMVVFVGINLVYAIPDLSHPESPAAFVTTAVVVGAGAITVGLGVLAARGRPASGARVWTLAVGGLVVIVACSLVAAAAVDDDEIRPGDTEIVARDLEFPAEVVVEPDSTAVFVRNEDRFRHTFVVEGAVDAVELPADTDVRVKLDLAPGTYRYFCDVRGHEDMEGTLIVR